jgi:hypothetical protein
MIRIILRCTVAVVLVLQLGCQMSQSADAPNVKIVQGLANETKGVPVQAIRLVPVDEAPQDPSFADFRHELLTAAQNHDAAFVLSIVDANIVNGADTERGVKEFKKQWQVDQPEGKLWETLATILTMGGSFRVTEGAKEFCAPYVTSKWSSVVSQLPQGADPLDYQVIIDKDVAMRTEPNSSATTVATLAYDVVRVSSAIARSGNSSGWMKITTLAGQEGFVADKYIRSATDYHAFLQEAGLEVAHD